MRRVVIVLSALAFAFAMNGEALAKDGKKKAANAAQTTEDKAANKERAQEHKVDKADAENKGAPLIRLHSSSGSHGKPDSSWLHDKSHKSY